MKEIQQNIADVWSRKGEFVHKLGRYAKSKQGCLNSSCATVVADIENLIFRKITIRVYHMKCSTTSAFQMITHFSILLGFMWNFREMFSDWSTLRKYQNPRIDTWSIHPSIRSFDNFVRHSETSYTSTRASRKLETKLARASMLVGKRTKKYQACAHIENRAATARAIV